MRACVPWAGCVRGMQAMQQSAMCVSPLPRGRSFTRPWIEGGRPSAESSGSDIVLDRSVTLHVSRVLGICVTLALCVSRHLSRRLLLLYATDIILRLRVLFGPLTSPRGLWRRSTSTLTNAATSRRRAMLHVHT